ncbi:DinB family protein [Mycobacterium sp. CBMA293]|uniref:DinB family protein n=1 Tax=unclassified Mycolicibacterium TaxID=2636767 RepID=UPI0012DBDB5A|nr:MULTISPECIES: DinB family protein [unclassified Mycolicibacterium]MUL45385.1 DinB family protein [Mycolicibacterium sp. CBMA 360]MUL56904.1 DinB family protein [Mycolicibacterium sp. CBMA 335]MUL69944.1 DinB family protein [Mycolicibacterium sp. CBMA 311]MUL91992.1 DinB family protein [Mycolicibacterium sp. CBMA 230]MUM05730.1 hypothetical protein [Mycolicibacterium sp. CBMA 213]
MPDYTDAILRTADDRTMLNAMLDVQRGELAALVAGITESDARRRLVPSLTTLLGLVKHGAFVEKVWFHHRVAGLSREELGIPEDVESSFRLSDRDTIESVAADFTGACRRSREIAADHPDLGAEFSRRTGVVTLRFIYTHMIQEYARHAGHGDILREQIAAQP